jgi:hypothetical protein
MPVVVTSVTAAPHTSVAVIGDKLIFTLKLSGAVTVTGGIPKLLLSDGGVAIDDYVNDEDFER